MHFTYFCAHRMQIMLPRLFMRNKNSEEKMLKCFRDRPTFMFWKGYCDDIELDIFSALNYFNGKQSSKLSAKYLNPLFIHLTNHVTNACTFNISD